LCKRFRIDNSKRDKHTALIDCELLYKVYINLFNQKEPSLDFNEATEKKLNFNNLKNMGYFKGIVIPSAEELELHKNFIKNSLKKNNF
jgi:DNA polymerase-3 subunit epsilon